MQKILVLILLFTIFTNTVLGFDFQTARNDYVFSEDKYKTDLFDFNFKKATYQKNQTLSLKEEFRLSTYKFVGSRNLLIKNYLTMLRIRTFEALGIDNSQKEIIYSKIDGEVNWFDNRKNNYDLTNTLEDIIRKSKEEDIKYETETLPVIYYALANISLGDAVTIKNKHVTIYNNHKKEAEELIKLGRADASLFDRWFKDIDRELELILQIENLTKTDIDKIFGEDTYKRQSGYENAIETLDPIKSNLLRLNSFVMELENAINTKR